MYWQQKLQQKTLTMLTESLFLHVVADNTVFVVTSGVGFLNIQVSTDLKPNLQKYCFF